MKPKHRISASLVILLLAGVALLLVTTGWSLLVLFAVLAAFHLLVWHYLRKYRLHGLVGSALTVGVFVGSLLLVTSLGLLIWFLMKGEWPSVARGLKWNVRYMMVLVPATVLTAMVAKSRKTKDPLFLFFLFLGMLFWSCFVLLLLSALVAIPAAIFAA